MTRRSSRSIRRAALAASATCVAGFGALLGFSIFTVKTPGLRGLFDYLSATWGDAVLLPVSMGALVYAYDQTPGQSFDRAIIAAGGLTGAVVGAATQVQWLADENPELNWTLPTPHHFNAAGVYHAVFLTTTSAVFGALWAGVIARRARTDSGPFLRRVDKSIAVAFLSSLGFVGLLLADNHGSAETRASHATVAAITSATAAAAIGLAVSSRWRARARRRRDVAPRPFNRLGNGRPQADERNGEQE